MSIRLSIFPVLFLNDVKCCHLGFAVDVVVVVVVVVVVGFEFLNFMVIEIAEMAFFVISEIKKDRQMDGRTDVLTDCQPDRQVDLKQGYEVSF